jgi:hypothetical protein
MDPSSGLLSSFAMIMEAAKSSSLFKVALWLTSEAVNDDAAAADDDDEQVVEEDEDETKGVEGHTRWCLAMLNSRLATNLHEGMLFESNCQTPRPTSNGRTDRQTQTDTAPAKTVTYALPQGHTHLLMPWLLLLDLSSCEEYYSHESFRALAS